MLLTDIGYGLSGLLGLGIIFIGTRFLLAPQVAAADFGIATGPGGGSTDPYLSVKGVRDIASGLVGFGAHRGEPRRHRGYPAPAAAMSPTDAAARQSPVSLVTVSRSPRNTRASTMVTAGYNEVRTAVTASRPACVA